MLLPFWLKNLNFGVELFGAVTLFLVAFLIFDAWSLKRELKTGLQGLGFSLLGLYFVITASNLSFANSELYFLVFKISALAILAAGLLSERFNPVPKNLVLIGLVPGVLSLVSPILMAVVTVFYFLKATKGYEKTLIWVFLGFVFLTFGDLIGSLSFLKNSDLVLFKRLFEENGAAFITTNLANLVGFSTIFVWALGYLRFRLMSQLFLYFTLGSLIIFLVTTFIFTTFLLNNLTTNAQNNLLTSAKSFEYSLKELEDKALLTARAVATNDTVKNQLQVGNRVGLYAQVTTFFFPTKGDSLLVTDKNGVVVVNSEDRDAFGNSVSGKDVVERARGGFEGVRTVADSSKGSAQLRVEAASPIKSGKEVIGVSVATYSIDNLFVDAVKAVTGLDVSVYSGKTKAATTFVAPNNKDRLTGAEETNATITKAVLEEGREVKTTKKVFGRDFTSVYLPIKNIDNKTTGMVFVGRPAAEILNTAEASINLTFLFSALLTLLSIGPSLLLARYINRNQKA